RHLQIHLKALGRKYPNSVIDESMIPKSIRESSMDIAHNFVLEYNVDHPNMDAFLKKLKGTQNVLPYSDFRKLIEEVIKLYSPELDIETKIDLLYKMNFFGVVEKVSDNYE